MTPLLKLRLTRIGLVAGALVLLVIAGAVGGVLAIAFRVLAVLFLASWIVVGILVARLGWRHALTPADPPPPVTREQIRRQVIYVAAYVGVLALAGIVALVLSFTIADLEFPLRVAGIGLLALAAASVAAGMLGLHRMRRRLAAQDA